MTPNYATLEKSLDLISMTEMTHFTTRPWTVKVEVTFFLGGCLFKGLLSCLCCDLTCFLCGEGS